MRKKIIVSGASGYLGRSIVSKLKEEGCDIIGLDVSKKYLTENEDDHQRNFVFDLTNEEKVTSFAREIQNDRSVKAVVMTVGGFAMGDFLTTSLEEVNRMIKLNFSTAFLLAKATIPILKKNNGGQIFLVGARPALDPKAGAGMFAYALSKSLIFRLCEIINTIGSDYEIRCTTIVPSILDTRANREAMPDANFEKWVRLEDVSETIAFLLSNPAIRQPVIKIYNQS